MKSEIFERHDKAGGWGVTTWVNRMDYVNNENLILKEIIEKVSDHVAAVFVEKHGPEIMAKLSADAIANLAIAAAGAQINETLQKKLPDKIIHHVTERVHTEVYQKGIFGGLKRL